MSTPGGLPRGLTAAEVAERHAEGRGNRLTARASRTVPEILRANVLTRFNAILGVLLAVIVVVGPLQDALFGVVLVLNILVGVVQELRAKHALDRMALLAAPHARVVRDGRTLVIDSDDVVEDDILSFRRGDEVVADAVVLSSTGFRVDESILTGEAEAVERAAGDEVLAGSLVSSGSALGRVVRAGERSFASLLGAEAKRFSLVRSELRAGIDRILRVVTWLLVPSAVLLVASQLRTDQRLDHALRASVAAVGSMVPEGLLLLSSIAFAVGVLRLARHQVLVQELAALEGLARVDVLCFDKTGTLTDGNLVVHAIDRLGEAVEVDVDAALGALVAADPEASSTSIAIAAHCSDPGWAVLGRVPFSSDRKWSAVDVGERGGVFVLGGPDVLLGLAVDPVRLRAATFAADGERVLLVARAKALRGEELPPSLEPVALVRLSEKLRPDAVATVEWFAAEGVELRVLSGDHPATAAAVARAAGIPTTGEPVDARGLPADGPELIRATVTARVVGRVSPEQKRSIVHALQAAGHTVGMTGDGVNDVLALKAADLGIAMGAGSEAARAVSRVVLVGNSFAALPLVVAEGRRVIGNVERVANLFLTKTVYAFLLAIAVGVAGLPFPFFPRHLTVISSLTIGIPGFFLALGRSADRARTGFVGRVLRFAGPAGLAAAAATLTAYGFATNWPGESTAGARTTATITLFLVGLWVLDILARPLTPGRSLLVAASAGAFVTLLLVPPLRTFFALELPDPTLVAIAIAASAAAAAALELGWRVSGWTRGH